LNSNLKVENFGASLMISHVPLLVLQLLVGNL
jgi:hypothetical protein